MRDPKRRQLSRRQVASAVARLVLLAGVLVAVGAPIAWERLPDYQLLAAPPRPAPPLPPGPGIDPKANPDPPKIIAPKTDVPTLSGGQFKYTAAFGKKPPYVSTCSPVPFTIRTKHAPVAGDRLIFDALQQIADISRISFEFVGYTDDLYKFNGRKVLYSWENERSPLWIGWATDGEVPRLGKKAIAEPYVLGLGGPSTSPRSDGATEIVGGSVTLRAGEDLPIVFGPGQTAGNLVFHEIGHVLGLDHVLSKAEQMYPSLGPSNPSGYGPGDRRGLVGIVESC